MKGYYAIDLTKAGLGHTSSENFKHQLVEKFESMPSYDPMIHMLPLKALWACFGPFETMKDAHLMSASELSDLDLDFFGHKWVFIELETKITSFQKVMIPKKYFVCSDTECKGWQRFKGFCSLCKSRDKGMVPTKLIRDWNGVFSQEGSR